MLLYAVGVSKSGICPRQELSAADRAVAARQTITFGTEYENQLPSDIRLRIDQFSASDA